MKIHREFEQGSLYWMQARAGVITASEFDNIITPNWKIRTGQMPDTYLASKLAEWWIGGPLPQFSTWDMDQGNILESEALPWYQLEHNTKVERVGFITTDDGTVGCSPDGLLDNGCGIEIKCPRMQTHVSYLMAGVLPPQYAAQVHGSMFVTDLVRWKFLSYCRGFPPLLLEIERDDEIQDAIEAALETFLERFAEGKRRLEEINGGPPQRRTPEQFKVAEPVDYDVVP